MIGTKSSKQHFELVLEQHGERAGPRRHHVIRLIDPADGLERDYKLLNQEGTSDAYERHSIILNMDVLSYLFDAYERHSIIINMDVLSYLVSFFLGVSFFL